METKIGKVIRVINPTEIVINLGAEDGVWNGSEFLIYTPGDDLTDPDTGESLGQLEIIRGRGKARHMQPRMTTVRSLERDKVIREAPRRIGYHGPPQTEEVEIVAPFENVQVGDLVRRLI